MPNAPILRPYRSDDRAAVERLWHDAWHDGHGAILPADIVAMVKAREKEILDGKYTVKVDDSQPKSTAK